MSRDNRDKRGGHEKPLHKYPIVGMVPSKLKRDKRKSARAKAKHDLRNGREPHPIYAPEVNYFD